MKAITLRQPWAWAVAHADKRIENRTWAPPQSLNGELIAIHAGKFCDMAVVREFRAGRFGEEAARLVFADLFRGGIIAVARITKVVEHVEDDAQRVWFSGPLAWVLEDVIPLSPPVVCRGQQGFWDVPEVVERAVMVQVNNFVMEEMMDASHE